MEIELPDTELSGVTVDDRGEAIANALVKLYEENVGLENTTWTDPDGRFSYRGLAEGRSRIVATSLEKSSDQVEVEIHEDRQAPELRLVLPSAQHSIRRLLDRHIKSGTIAPARVMEMDGLGATMRMVEATTWSTLLPSVAVAHDARSDRFVLNPIADPPRLTSDIYAMHAPERPPSLAAQRFVDVVERELERSAATAGA